MSICNNNLPTNVFDMSDDHRYFLIDVEDLILDYDDPMGDIIDYFFMVGDNATGKTVEYNGRKMFGWSEAQGLCDFLNGLIPEEKEEPLEDPVEVTA